MFFAANANANINLIYTLFPIIFFPFLHLYLSKKRSYLTHSEQKKLQDYYIGFCILLLLSALFNLDFRGGYVVVIMFFVTSYLYVRNVPFTVFITAFEKIIWWITIVSVPVFILCYFFPNIRLLLPVLTNASFYTYANIFITVVPLFDVDSSAFRLYGPFNEPGMYQVHLNLALLFHIYLNGRLQFNRAIIYILAILLTQSTTGYICLAIVLVSFISSLSRRNYKFKNYLIAGIIIISYIFLYTQTMLFSSESDVFVKFSGEGSSIISREASIYVNGELFLSHPFFGVGFSEIIDKFEVLCQSKYGFTEGIANTNTVLYQFAALGFFYGILWIYCVIRFFKRFGNNTMSKWLIILAVLLTMSGELVLGCFWLYLFLGYGLIGECENLILVDNNNRKR